MGHYVTGRSGVEHFVPTSRNTRARIDALKKRLLEDHPALLLKARGYLDASKFGGARAGDFVKNVVSKLELGGNLTPDQWAGLAGAVAYVDVKEQGEG